jgi:hypothetical protein
MTKGETDMENRVFRSNLNVELRRGKGAYQIERAGCFWLLYDTRNGTLVDFDEEREALVAMRNRLNTNSLLNEVLA